MQQDNLIEHSLTMFNGRATRNEKEVLIDYIPFPENVQGFVYGMIAEQKHRYIILIDSTRCGLVQRRAIGHELAHLCLNHLHNGKPAAENEREANARTWEFYRRYKDIGKVNAV